MSQMAREREKAPAGKYCKETKSRNKWLVQRKRQRPCRKITTDSEGRG